MLMQEQLFADVIRIGLFSPKNLGTFAVQNAAGNELINRSAG
jgi:hypothetical protein